MDVKRVVLKYNDVNSHPCCSRKQEDVAMAYLWCAEKDKTACLKNKVLLYLTTLLKAGLCLVLLPHVTWFDVLFVWRLRFPCAYEGSLASYSPPVSLLTCFKDVSKFSLHTALKVLPLCSMKICFYSCEDCYHVNDTLCSHVHPAV